MTPRRVSRRARGTLSLMDTRALAPVAAAALLLAGCTSQQPAPPAAATTTATTAASAFASPQDMEYRIANVVDVSDCTDPVHDAEQAVSVECSIIGTDGSLIRMSVVAPSRIEPAVEQLDGLGWISRTGAGWIVSTNG